MMKTKLLFLACLIILSGCRSIIGKMNHVSKPQPETEQSVAEYLGKIDYQYIQQMFTIKDSVGFLSLMSTLGGRSRFMIFNRNGECLVDTTGGCSGKEEQFVVGLKAGMDYPVDPEIPLTYFQPLVKPFGISRIEPPSKFDYTVLAFWGIYMGKFNQNVFDLAARIQERNDLKVQIIFVNMDIQKSWGLKSKVRISFS